MISCNESTLFPRDVELKATGISHDSRQKGFTLLELIVVLFIIGVIIGLVVPKGYKVYEQARTSLARLEDGGFKKKTVFQAFLLDKDCDVKYDNGRVSLWCGDSVVLTRDSSRKFDDTHISKKGFVSDRN